jgi:hypothetical protein
MGLLPLTYTRPKHVEKTPRDHDSFNEREETEGSVRSGNSGSSAGIPDSLAFDKIINGGTCPPMTVRDFMNYLTYVEHAAENLQFFLWFKDYEKRFLEASPSELVLAPEWTQAMEEEAVAKIRKDNVEKRRAEAPEAAIFRGTDFDGHGKEHHGSADMHDDNPFSTPPRTPASTHQSDSASVHSSNMRRVSTYASTYKSQAAEAFHSAGVRQPFTIQPFREEINRVVATYIMQDAPRQLNLASWEQKAAVQALSHTTHPSAFRVLVRSVEASLRRQAHPNFVRWSICNGNPARTCFATILGVLTTVIGFVVAIVLTLSSVGRGYRALAAIAWVIGISTLIASLKGMCVVLHGMHHRQVRPWELFVHDGEMVGDGKLSFDSLKSGSSNSYESEPWVVKYDKRNIVRKVFDREIWIQEPALRQIQDTIFVQSMLAALLLGGVFTAIFVSVPGGHYF